MRGFPLVKAARAVGWCPSFIPLESWHWWRWWMAGTSTTNGGGLCLRPDPRVPEPTTTRTICGQIHAGTGLTGPYVKVCAEHLAELEQWANDTVGQPISPCGTCRPGSGAVQPAPVKQTVRTADGREYASC